MSRVLLGPDGQSVELALDPKIMAVGAPAWDDQAAQYPQSGAPGIRHYAGKVWPGKRPVDCLLYRDLTGQLRGIANYYAVNYLPFERAGNVLILVDPEWRRIGVAMSLLDEVVSRYGPLDFAQQKYSPAGMRVAKKWLERAGWREAARA